MYSKKEIIVIVDSFSSGIHYAPIFSGLGFHCLHIYSNYNFYKDKPLAKEFFIDSLIFIENNIEKLIKKIKKYKVKAIIAGSESAIYLTDLIASRFGVLKNDLITTKARRNKFLMIDTLKNKNIPCAKQFLSSNLDELINWYRSSHFQKVVIKPTLSTASDGVRICENIHQIKEAFNTIIHKRNFIGFLNEELVLQEYLEGVEYIVNTVSCQGIHFITDIPKAFDI